MVLGRHVMGFCDREWARRVEGRGDDGNVLTTRKGEVMRRSVTSITVQIELTGLATFSCSYVWACGFWKPARERLVD